MLNPAKRDKGKYNLFRVKGLFLSIFSEKVSSLIPRPHPPASRRTPSPFGEGKRKQIYFAEREAAHRPLHFDDSTLFAVSPKSEPR